MGIVILIITVALIIITVFLALSKAKLQKKLSETSTRNVNNALIYEDVDLSQIIDSMKNVAYEAPQLQT